MDPNAPDTAQLAEGLQWIITAFLLASATVAPIILRPIIEYMKKANANSTGVDLTGAISSTPQINGHIPSHHSTGQQMAVVGGTLANKEAVMELSIAINRLVDVIKERIEREEEESEEEKLRKMIKTLMRDLKEQ